MIKTIKVKLNPNNKQKSRLFAMAGTARYAYNWALARQIENKENGNKYIKESELRKEFTQLKQIETWLNQYSNNITKQAIKDCHIAFQKFFNHLANFPRFKKKNKSTPSFYVDTSKIQITDTHVKLEKVSLSTKKTKRKLNFIRLAEKGKIPLNVKYYNPRVTFDGLHWYLSIGYEVTERNTLLIKEGIGIDLGIKELAICSNDKIYPNINKSERIKKLKKRKRRLQRRISRKYEMNKKGVSYCKTSNIIKSEHKLKKLQKRLNHIRENYLHQVTTKIIKQKPSFIVLEDLNVKGIMKNKHLSEKIAEQKLSEFRQQIEYKAKLNGIPVVIADRFYGSSKTCSRCGSYKKNLKLKDRIYECPECGLIIDRDLNASLNLKAYGYKALYA